MTYRFPEIRTIDDVLPLIAGREEFVVGERQGFTFIDYVVTFPDSFPDPAEGDISPEEAKVRAIRRECRGIKFLADGTIGARPYHKFFNIGEKTETQPGVLDLSREDWWILEKLDGSMVHPLWVEGKLQYCTRMGLSDTAKRAAAFATKNQAYYDFCLVCEQKGWTPIFEWCSRRDPIVLDYPQDELIVTALRQKISGRYAEGFDTIAASSGLTSVPAWGGTWEGIQKFLHWVKGLENAEGFVIRWQDGHMVKTKGDWYTSIHRTKESIAYEKNVIALIVEDRVDDVLPSLLPRDADRLRTFQRDFWVGVGQAIEETKRRVERHIAGYEGPPELRGRWFAENAAPQFEEPLKALAFAIHRGRPPVEHVRRAIARNTGSRTRIENIRALFGGINWLDY